jgi:hypothetical protein
LITGGGRQLQAFVPITFETTIRYAAFGRCSASGAQWPPLYHPGFGAVVARASNDGFFLFVEARPWFDRVIMALLEAHARPRSS